MTRLTGGARAALPGPGAVALAYGNSISDLSAGLGQWFTAVCNRRGWIRANSNLLGNGNFESDITYADFGIQWETLYGDLTLDMTYHKFGVQSAKLTPTSTLYGCTTSPFNVVAGDKSGGDTNAPTPTNAMQGSTQYVFSVWVYLPSGTTVAPQIVFYDQVNYGSFVPTYGTSASLTAPNTWQQISFAHTTPALLTRAFVRIEYQQAATTPAKPIWIDGAMLEVASGANLANPQPTAGYSDNATRAAISGAMLQDIQLMQDRAGAIYSNGVLEDNGYSPANFGTRVANFAPDIVFVMFSTNDLYNCQQLYPDIPPGDTITTYETWRRAITADPTIISPYPQHPGHGLLYQLLQLPKIPRIVWCGELMTTWTWADNSLDARSDPYKAPAPTIENGYIDAIASKMDDVARKECAAVTTASVQFIPIRPFMQPALCGPSFLLNGQQTNGNKHPSVLSGMQFLTSFVAQMLEEG